jgi:toxin ParE1/3/4
MNYKLSKKADKDFEDIYRYTYIEFGEHQADKYTDSLEACFLTICDNPKIGRNADYISKGLYQHEHKEHIIFYKIRKQGIFIVRLLHKSMKINNHL